MPRQLSMIAKLPGRSEYAESVTLTDYLRFLHRQGKVILYSHIPNSTYTKSWSAKRKNTAMGLVPGMPDYVVIIQDKILFIELKREKEGVISPSQKLWLANLPGKTTYATVAKGFEQAKAYIDSFLTAF